MIEVCKECFGQGEVYIDRHLPAHMRGLGVMSYPCHHCSYRGWTFVLPTFLKLKRS